MKPAVEKMESMEYWRNGRWRKSPGEAQYKKMFDRWNKQLTDFLISEGRSSGRIQKNDFRV